MADFNVHHGFIEGIVRGFKSGFITDNVSEGGGEIGDKQLLLLSFSFHVVCNLHVGCIGRTRLVLSYYLR